MSVLPVYVPSWVIPGSPSANAAFLRGRVHGVMLCCFEHAPRLPVELPSSDHGLEWHVHLPVDLPWERGGAAAGEAACRVVDEAACLLAARSRCVLHMPPAPGLLADFLRAWEDGGRAANSLLLENLPDTLFAEWLGLPDLHPGLRLCLDIAHLMLAGQGAQAAACIVELAGKVDMFHWSAPKHGKDAHAPLTALDAEQKTLYRYIAEHIPGALDVIEVFDWQGAALSWTVLREWRAVYEMPTQAG